MSEEMRQRLVERYESELNDVLTYNTIYEKMLTEHLDDDASVIEHIARQEFNHAQYIREMLKEVGMFSADERIKALEQKVCKVFGL